VYVEDQLYLKAFGYKESALVVGIGTQGRFECPMPALGNGENECVARQLQTAESCHDRHLSIQSGHVRLLAYHYPKYLAPLSSV
jgi:hypothetical protein